MSWRQLADHDVEHWGYMLSYEHTGGRYAMLILQRFPQAGAHGRPGARGPQRAETDCIRPAARAAIQLDWTPAAMDQPVRAAMWIINPDTRTLRSMVLGYVPMRLFARLLPEPTGPMESLVGNMWYRHKQISRLQQSLS